MLEFLVIAALIVPTLIAGLFVRNLWLFTRAPQGDASDTPAVSILIPARNEASGIFKTLQHLRAAAPPDAQILVLDDHSTDETAEIVRKVSMDDSRVRLIRGAPLPDGWCGKQFACHQLAEAAQHDHLLFLDADVHLHPRAIRRALAQFRRAGSALVSGFPQQQVGTLGEALLIPLIHVVLLSYLPFDLMRRTRMLSAAAGCGQLFITHRTAYRQVGGHAAIRNSRHDGITLPRAYRQHGFGTDVFDASDLAACRMYEGGRATWDGLMKNAHEGMANFPTIVPATMLMVFAVLVPTAIGVQQLLAPTSTTTWGLAAIAVTLAFLPRLICAVRFDRAWGSSLLFPLSCTLFLVLQWMALIRHQLGMQTAWRGRTFVEPSSRSLAQRAA